MRKTIYVPNQEVWDKVKVKAGESNLSVSQYLLTGKFQANTELSKKASKALDTMSKSEVIDDTKKKIRGMAGKPIFNPQPKRVKK